MLTELVRGGLIEGAAHVVEADDPVERGRFFQYRISRTEEEIRKGAKSRYYPVELSNVLREIRSVPGRYAVVGVPCFIKAIQLMRREDALLRERIPFTLGLFCGHMKSARFVESLAWQMGVSLGEVQRIDFRLKDEKRPANWYRVRLTLKDGRIREEDWWNLVDGDWGAGFFQNRACNFCDDVVAETADISFGDAWSEPYSSDGKGTNVVIVRSGALEKLLMDAIEDGRLRLEPVGDDFVEKTQAAGFRQRREGLAYRLTWGWRAPKLQKRVSPSSGTIALSRKVIYRMRAWISRGSRRVFWLARCLHWPGLYLRWASACLAIYQAVTYGRGWLGRVLRARVRQ